MKIYWTYVGLEFLIYKAGKACGIIRVCLASCNNVSANVIKLGMHIKQLEATLVACCLIFCRQWQQYNSQENFWGWTGSTVHPLKAGSWNFVRWYIYIYVCKKYVISVWVIFADCKTTTTLQKHKFKFSFLFYGSRLYMISVIQVTYICTNVNNAYTG